MERFAVWLLAEGELDANSLPDALLHAWVGLETKEGARVRALTASANPATDSATSDGISDTAWGGR